MKSMGGDDSPNNIVVLTAKEHYIAHHLLHKIHKNRYTGAAWASMTSNKNGNRYVSRTWSAAREAGIQSHIGSKRSLESRRRMSIAATGRKASESARKKMSESRKGELNNFYGKKHTEETKDIIRRKRLGKHGRPVIATCMSTGEKFKFPNAHYACKEDGRGIGRDSSAIYKACRGLIKHHNKYLWEFADTD